MINLRKTCQNNPLIGINSLREKIVSLREVSSKASFDILCVDETKLDASFPDHQFKYQGINSHQLEEIVILREGGIVFVRKGFLVKQMKNFETENPEAICLELVIAKKKWCILFAYRPPDTNKTMFFNEIYVTLNKILGKYDNILLAGDLNIDELKTGSDSSNHLSDAKTVFNLTNLIKKPTCFKSQDGTLIDLMLTNRPRSFSKSQNFEIGLSDCHMLVVCILRASFKKLPRKIITYRDQKRFNQDHFFRDLDSRLLQGELYRNCDEPYKKITEIFNDILNHHTPLKQKQVRGNHAPFMTKYLSKAINNEQV